MTAQDPIAEAATAKRLPNASDGPNAWDTAIALVTQARDLLPGTPEAKADYEALLSAMRARDQFGRAKYGMPLRPGNGQDSLQEAIQEVLDAVAYLCCRSLERPDDLEAGHDLGIAMTFAYRLVRRFRQS